MDLGISFKDVYKLFSKNDNIPIKISKSCEKIKICYNVIYRGDDDKKCVVATLEDLDEKGLILKQSIFYPDYDVNDGYYISQDGAFSEILISSIISDHYDSRKKFCINFGSYKSIFFCLSGDEYESYMIMEKITNNIEENPITSFHCARNFLLQTLLTVKCANLLEINHNDLHNKNIMYKVIGEEDKYKNKRIKNYTHFQYNINGEKYYIQNNGVLFKLLDFDFSSKFKNKTPGVFRDDILKDEYLDYNITNKFQESYDIFMALSSLWESINIPKFRKLCENILYYYTDTNFYGIENSESRPSAEYSNMNIDDIFKVFFKDYKEKPDGKILLVCDF